MKRTVLIVDDDLSIRESLKLLLEESYNTVAVASGEEALGKLDQINVDALFLDVKMDGMDGLETLKRIRERHEYLVVIMLTVLEDIKTAISAIKLGANDYLRKPYEKDELLLTLEKNLLIKNGHREMQYLRSELDRIYQSKIILGHSLAMKKVFKLIDKAAMGNTTVVITGETGTGKELVAIELHKSSPRRDMPFVVVNCAAIPKELMESTLFGHERGAFTGAHKQKLGKIEIAGGGIVFFDEIGSLPYELQGKLLRVLQEKSFERVGGTVTIPTNARFFFATNDDLKEKIKNGKFRQDLYYRINVFPIHLPPLRERKDDIKILVKHFIKKFSKEQGKNIQNVSADAMKCLIHYPWNGNVRQLENEIEKVVTMANYDLAIVTPELLSEDIQLKEDKRETESTGRLNDALDALERKMIRDALEKSNGNKTKAAEYLGISRRGFHKKLIRLNI